MAFGDLYLADIRAYREQQLQGTGITPLFPLWNEPTNALARRMIDAVRDRRPVRRKRRVPQLRLRRANVPHTDCGGKRRDC